MCVSVCVLGGVSALRVAAPALSHRGRIWIGTGGPPMLRCAVIAGKARQGRPTNMPKTNPPASKPLLLFLSAFAVCLPALLAGCKDTAEQKLRDALTTQAGIKALTIDDKNINVTCSSEEKITVPTAELERNFLGMSKPATFTPIAKKIADQCEQKDKATKVAAAQHQNLVDGAKDAGVPATGDDAALRTAICEKLAGKLPVRDPARMLEAGRNTARFGCTPPPAAAELPTGLWRLEELKQKKPTQIVKVESEQGEKLALRCVGGKSDMYLQLATAVKKGTKVIDASVDGRAAKWKVKPSADGKAIFFADLAGTKRTLASSKQLALKIPTSKKAVDVGFDVHGFTEAVKPLPRGCR